MIEVMYGQNKFSTKPEELSFEQYRTFGAFIASLKLKKKAATSKDEITIFTPSSYKARGEWVLDQDGNARGSRNVDRVNALVLDFDDITLEELERLDRSFNGIHYLRYTTFSHQGDSKGRYRFVVELDHSVAANRWPDFWSSVHTVWALGLADEAPKSCASIFYVPATRNGAQPLGWRVFEGSPLVVPEEFWPENNIGLNAGAPSRYDLPDGEQQLVTKEDLLSLGRKLKSQGTSPGLQKRGEQFIAIAEGREFAPQGERHKETVAHGRIFGKEFPYADPHQIAELYDGLTNNSIGETAKTLAWGFDRGRQEFAQDESLKEVLCQPDLTIPTERLNEFKDELGYKDLDEFFKSVIIARDKVFYVFDPIRGHYRQPVTGGLLPNLFERLYDNVPFVETRAQRKTKTGWQDAGLKGTQTLVSEYAQISDFIVSDLTLQKSYYDAKSLTYYEAICPRRKVQAKEHKLVDDWLKAMAGTEYNLVRDWLSLVPDLNKPLAALYLGGHPGVGKSLFAKGVARIWSEVGAVSAEKVMSSAFNSSLAMCPVVFADERLPSGMKNGGTGEIREFIQATSRPLSRKFIPDSQLKGAVRLILAANNLKLIQSKEELTNDDVAAIAERILYIHCSDQAKTYLDGLGGRAFVEENFLGKDWIAEHVLWLHDNHKPTITGRFGVQSNNKLIAHVIALSGKKGAACGWFIRYLQDPTKLAGKPGVKVDAKELFVSTEVLADEWDIYTNAAERPPDTATAGEILRSLTSGEAKRKRFGPGGKNRIKCWPISTEMLLVFSDLNGISSREEILKGLGYTQKEIDAQKA